MSGWEMALKSPSLLSAPFKNVVRKILRDRGGAASEIVGLLLFSLLLGTLIQDVYESLIQKAGKPRNINNIFSFSKELCLLYFSIPPSLMVKLMLTIYIPPCCQCEKYRFLRRTIKMESLFPTRRKSPPTGSCLA